MTRLACLGSLRRTLLSGLAATSLLGVVACSGDIGDRCEKNSDCASNNCRPGPSGFDGVCVASSAGLDSGGGIDTATQTDAAGDAETDAEQDASTD